MGISDVAPTTRPLTAIIPSPSAQVLERGLGPYHFSEGSKHYCSDVFFHTVILRLLKHHVSGNDFQTSSLLLRLYVCQSEYESEFDSWVGELGLALPIWLEECVSSVLDLFPALFERLSITWLRSAARMDTRMCFLLPSLQLDQYSSDPCIP